MDSSTGAISVVAALDYESEITYVLTVYAIDKEAAFRTGSATVSIVVTDVNDNAPICTASLYAQSIAEDAVLGTAVTTVNCNDADISASFSTVTYSITSAQPEFSIDANSGQITVSQSLDAETTSGYDLMVEASDTLFTTVVSVAVTITSVNDIAPVFSPAGPYSTEVTENLPIGSTVYDINATDGDIGNTAFIFSLTSESSDKFRIGTSSGVIQTQKSIDRDDPLTTSYRLGILVADGTGSDALTSTTSIDISIADENDNYPECDNVTYTASVLENYFGTVITPVCDDADKDASPTLAFSKVSGSDLFQVNTGTGVLSIPNGLDYEAETSYEVIVNVDDQGSPNKITELTMLIYVDPVNENRPVFQGLSYDTSILENLAHGSQVVIISATDEDEGSTHGDVTYAITGGNDEGKFSINPSTGIIQVSGVLDRETTSTYSLTVTAKDMIDGDADQKTAENTFVVTIEDVNDNYPVIKPASYAITLNENAVVGASVLQISATDDDDGTAGTLTYSFSDGNTANVFSITSDNGWIELSGDIDVTVKDTYVLTVKVNDDGNPALSSYTTVTIQVVAVNEHAPGFTSSETEATVSEMETVGNSIAKVQADDNDTGVFSELRFYIRGGNTDTAFTIDPFSGEIRVANALDYDTLPDVYNLQIEVEDTARSTNQTQTTTVTFTVSLSDANDEIPTFTSNTYPDTLNENENIGTSVLTVTALDSDRGGTNGDVTYSFVTGTGLNVFDIDPTSGVISTAADINYEEMRAYDLIVQAVDGGTPQQSSTCVIRISINDLNDEIPTFAFTEVAVSISENMNVGDVITTAEASDTDSAVNGNNVIQYSFQDYSSKFQIDQATGIITIMNRVDREEDSR